jgi:hypothetical protein
MESTLKNINSKTYGIVTDPTYISYSLIGFTTLILGYYVFYDKNSAGISSEDVASESSPKSDDANATSSEAPSALGGMFGSENKDESTISSEDTNASSALGGLFGSETKDAAEPAPSVFGTSEEPKEEKTVGGKRKKTRRERKQSRKQNKSKTNKSRK